MKKPLFFIIFILASPLFGEARPVKYFNKWLSILMNNIKYSLASILLLILFLFNGGTGVAQPTIQWQNTIGGSANDNLRSIQQTSDGGYILGGRSASGISGDKTDTSRGGFDYWVVKLNISGAIQWQNTIGGSSSDRLYSIQQTSDGGYILGGYSSSGISGDKTENSQGSDDYWVVKLDTSGAIQWQNTIGGSASDVLFSIQQTIDGGYILGGYSSSNISGDKTENSQGSADYWVVKLDTSGAIQWQNTIGGSSTDELWSIQQTSDGGYVLGGYSISDSTGDKTENSQGGADYWVVKLDASGAIQWQNTIGGSGSDYLYSIQQTSDGGYILGGYSYSNISGDKTENSQGSADYWVVKLDNSGAIQWQNTIGGSGSDYLLSIQQTNDGGYFLGGYSTSDISGDKTENSQGLDDYWVVKLDASGAIQWQNTIGGSFSDYLQSIQQTSDGGYVLVGDSYSNISGDKTENSQGGADYWVVKLCGADSTNTSQSICAGDSALIFGVYQSAAGAYYNTLTNINGCDSIIGITVTINPNPIFNVADLTNASCFGLCDGIITITPSGGTAPYSYSWSGGAAPNDSTNTGLCAGQIYSVVVTDANGCVAPPFGGMGINEPPELVIATTILYNATSCGSTDGSATVSAGGGTPPYTHQWNTAPVQTNDTATGLAAGDYTVTVTDTSGCITTDSVTIAIVVPLQPICLITVDSTSTKNVIVWEKPITTNIDSFRILREFTTNNYLHIGSVAYSDLSVYIDNDPGINPNITSYRYRMSVLDTCGNESDTSDLHKTIHLQVFPGVPPAMELSWDDYEGFVVNSYRILRDSTGLYNWELIGTVALGTNSWTDINPPQNARYIVEVVPPDTCIATQKAVDYNSSRSNTQTSVTGINEFQVSGFRFQVYPNPNRGVFTLSTNYEFNTNLPVRQAGVRIVVYDVLGEEIFKSEANNLPAGRQGQKSEIDISAHPAGIYHLQVITDMVTVHKKVVIE